MDTVCKVWVLTSIEEKSNQIAFHEAAFHGSHEHHYVLQAAVLVRLPSVTKTPLDVMPYRNYRAPPSAIGDSLAIPDEESVFPRAQLSRGSSHQSQRKKSFQVVLLNTDSMCLVSCAVPLPGSYFKTLPSCPTQILQFQLNINKPGANQKCIYKKIWKSFSSWETARICKSLDLS